MNRPIPQKGDHIPGADHVLRYIKPTQIDGDVVNGEGFLTRPGEDAASVNWIEYFDPPIENQVAGVRNAVRLNVARAGRLVRLNIGHAIEYVRKNDPMGLILSFVHDPLEANERFAADPSHALIQGIPMQNTPEAAIIKDLIAHCILSPHFPAKP